MPEQVRQSAGVGRAPRPEPAPGGGARTSVAPRLALIVFLLGLCMTALAWRTSSRGINEAERQRFARLNDKLLSRMNLRLIALEDGLRSTRGIFVASKNITRDEFHAYADSRELSRRFPGLLGLGFVARVAREDLPHFLERTRVDGMPDFTITSTGDHEALYILKFIEPLSTNRPALGLDLAANPALREATDHAMLTGEVAVTRMLELAQAPGRPGLVMFMPIYSSGATPATEQARRESLIGWASAPMHLDAVLNGLDTIVDGQLALEIFDGRSVSAGSTLYESTSRPTPAPGTLRDRVSVSVGGRKWTVEFRATPAFYAATEWTAVYWEAATGLTTTILLTVLVLTLGRSRQRALRIAGDVSDALHESEERWQLAVIANSEGIWDWDLASQRMYFSPVWLKQLGLADRDTDGTYDDWASRVHPDDLSAIVEAMQAYVSGLSEEFRREFRMRHTDGSWRWILSRGVAKRDASGRAVRVIGSHADVTERRDAEQALRDSERFARGTFDSLSSHIAILDGGGRVVATNKSWQEFARSLFDENLNWIGADYLAICEREGPNHIADTTFVARGIREVIARIRDEFSHEYSCPGGANRTWFHVRVTRFAGEGPLRIVVSHENVTDRRLAMEWLQTYADDLLAAKTELELQTVKLARANAAAEAANRAKSAFLANMSHEIRTPMTAILGFAELLIENDRTDRERNEFGDTIKRNGEHLLSIINDILDLSKIEAGRMLIERIPCSVRSLTAEIVELLAPRAHDKGLNFVCRIQDAVPDLVLTDPTRLRQILLNLAGNAIKFTNHGCVELTARHEDGMLSVDVRDSGIGIDPEHVSRLFEPFAQADESMSRRFGGTGLGLPISRRLAELLGGTLSVESAVGRGSLFSMSINAPAVAASSAPARPPALHTPHAERHTARILIVEDGPDNQRLISHFLRHWGAAVEIADNGQEGMQRVLDALASGTPFDLILMDMQMPVLDGYAATRNLRSLRITAPIIALTAHAMIGDKQACIDAGCDDYLTKPVNRRHLLATCAQWLNSPAAGMEHRAASAADSSHDRLQSTIPDPRSVAQ